MRNRKLSVVAIMAGAALTLWATGIQLTRSAVADELGELPRGDDNSGRMNLVGTLELTLNDLTDLVRSIEPDQEVVVPKGVEARLTFAVPPALSDRVTVEWVGVSESDGRAAVVRIPESGAHTVSMVIHQATRSGQADGIVQHRSFTIRALDVSPEDVKVLITYPGGDPTPPVDVNGDFHINAADRNHFWASYGESRGGQDYRLLSDWDGNGSVDLGDLVRFVDAFRDVDGRDVGATYGNGLVMPITSRPRPDETAFATPAPLAVAVTEPEGLEGWIEWRLDGVLASTGPVFSRPVTVPGGHDIEVAVFGFGAQDVRTLTTYSVIIRDVDRSMELRSGADFLKSGITYHLEAVTEPPGFEHLVNWYASTLYGSVSASHTRGARFDVRFDDTFGPDGSEWLGVQADNGYLNQDQKIACTFVDDFNDGIVNSSVYSPLPGTTLSEVNGDLVVTPSGPGGGLLITNPCPLPTQVSSSNPDEAWHYILDFLPQFAASNVGEIRMSSLGPGGLVIQESRYDNVTDLISTTVGNRFGGTITRVSGSFDPVRRLTEERSHSCSWIPPGWSSESCCYYILPPVVYWEFGAFGDAPVDASLQDVPLTKIQFVAAEPFRIGHLQIDQGDQSLAPAPWTLSPSHVNTSGGETVTIDGSGFLSLGPFSIRVGATLASGVQVLSDGMMTFTAPPNPRGLTDVRLETPADSLTVLFDNDFRYYASTLPLLLSRSPQPVGNTGVFYSTTIGATGGSGARTFTLASGLLPPGLNMSAGGLVSGTPIQQGVFSFFVHLTDVSGEEDVRMFLIEVQ